MTSHDRGSTSISGGEGPRSSHVEETNQRKKKKKHLPLWQETVLLLVVALVLAVVIKTFFVQAFYIPSASMEPGLVLNDRILIQKVSYWGDGEPERGDVIVFKDPGGWLGADAATPPNAMAKVLAKVGLYPAGGHLVKRVVGVAGDTVACCDAKGRVLVNGEPIEGGRFLKEGAPCDGPMTYQDGCRKNWEAGPIPPGHIFVMGDNRANSSDSSARLCKPDVETDCVEGKEFVPVDLVVGKVFVLLWPADRFSWTDRPDTFEDVPDPKS